MSILSTQAPTASAAQLMSPQQRQRLAIEALHGIPLCQLARCHGVSTRFVRRQRHLAQDALDRAFCPPPAEDHKVLCRIDVTPTLLHRLILALLLVGHCSIRGVQEILHDVFDLHKSVGSICCLAQRAAASAETLNAQQDLSAVKIAALDEIFSNHKPVLAVVDVETTYCCSLSLVDHRDGDTWALHLRQLQAQGFAPNSTIADAAGGLRKGAEIALPGTPCHADNWHALRDTGDVVRFLENRAYAAIDAADRLSRRLLRKPGEDGLRERAEMARREQDRAITLADDVAVLAGWLRKDVLAVAGPPLEQRRILYEVVHDELRRLRGQCEHRLGPVCTMLANQKENLLGFCVQMDVDVSSLSAYARVSQEVVRKMIAVQEMAQTDGRRWRLEGELRKPLGSRYAALWDLVGMLRRGVVRASSAVENVNSRLRPPFFLRKGVSENFLQLQRFSMNHRKFARSKHEERVGKSPAELLNGEEQKQDWMTLLGYPRECQVQAA